MNELIVIYSFARALRVKHGIKQATQININLITRHQIKFTDINTLTNMFNINIEKMDDCRINHKANIESIGDVVIEYENIYTDTNKEKEKLEAQLMKIDAEIKRSTMILSNSSFISKAPADKVQAEKKKLEQYQTQYKQIKEAISKLK
ncbi:hypothetical protein FACS1894166_06860 [Bacilli bacterium]|nr:hypothetical protein FACS1894166_06860 [Bacilli bacterium]